MDPVRALPTVPAYASAMRAVLSCACAILVGCGAGSIGAAEQEPSDDAAQSEVATSLPDADLSDVSSDAIADATIPEKPGVRLVGRFEDATGGPRFAWSGSQIRARFSGTGARLKLSAPNNAQFEVVVDGTVQPMLDPVAGTTLYPIATGLSPGTHDVVIWRRTEAFFGIAQYQGIEIDGELLAPEPTPSRRIEIVGDSITCGYGDEGTSAACDFSADTENHYRTYGAIAARALGADLVTTCWSGLGMYRNYGGDTTGTMPERWPRTFPQNDTSTWDFAKYVPDVVVINLGTNDFAKGDPGTAYRDAYLAFVKKLRVTYPPAQIVAIIPVAGAKKYIDAMLATLTSEGETKVTSLQLSAITTADGWGCDYHPTVVTHARWGKELETALRTRLSF